MSDWSKDFTRRMREHSKELNLKAEKSLQDKKTRDNALAEEWSNLGRLLKQMCKDLGEELEAKASIRCDASDQEIVLTLIGSGAKITGTKSPVTYEMNFSGTLANGYNWHKKYWVKLAENGLSWFIEDIDRRSFRAEEVADRILSALVGMRD